MSRFLCEKYEDLEPYTPGEQPRTLQKLIKLNTNESPYKPSPKVFEAIAGAEAEAGELAEVAKLRLYSDPEAKELVTAIAEYYQLPREQVFVGNGSDEILAFVFMAFQRKGRVYFPSVSYGFYPVYAKTFGAQACPIPLKNDLTIAVEDYKNLEGTVIIANPNAPTGIALSRAQIEEILISNRDNLVLIDEAYVDFGAESCVPLIEKYDNLLVCQTFSKSRSLAGARIGFALGNKEIISDLNRIKFSFNPYNLNRLSILAGAAAMRDKAYFTECTAKIAATRERFVKALCGLGFTVLPSRANFVFAKSGRLSGEAYFTGLREKNILVRHFNDKRICDYVRITIGGDEEMDALLAATRELLDRA